MTTRRKIYEGNLLALTGLDGMLNQIEAPGGYPEVELSYGTPRMSSLAAKRRNFNRPRMVNSFVKEPHREQLRDTSPGGRSSHHSREIFDGPQNSSSSEVQSLARAWILNLYRLTWRFIE